MHSTLALLALALATPAAAADIPCRDHAMAQAERLLRFHAEADDVHIDPDPRAIAPLKNPAAPEQRFDVLELHGHVYRANYRIRLIYHVAGESCLLMGQEILEHARL